LPASGKKGLKNLIWLDKLAGSVRPRKEMRAHPAIVGRGGAAARYGYLRISIPRPARQPKTLVCVRVTGIQRITFGWSGKSALAVDLKDYH